MIKLQPQPQNEGSELLV